MSHPGFTKTQLNDMNVVRTFVGRNTLHLIVSVLVEVCVFREAKTLNMSCLHPQKKNSAVETSFLAGFEAGPGGLLGD